MIEKMLQTLFQWQKEAHWEDMHLRLLTADTGWELGEE